MRKEKSLQVESMATYRIRVQGELGEEWSARLHNLVISAEATDTDELPVTILTGQLPDQDGLRQVVNTLYDQRLPLLSLEYLEEDETQNWQRLNDKDHLSDNA
jgi:hypothetical protein